MNRKLRANLMLLLTAFIWGVAFVAQEVAMDSLPPFAFNAARMLLAALTLALCVLLLQRVDSLRRRKAVQNGLPYDESSALTRKPRTPVERRTLWIGGVCCGVLLFLASSFQQLGIKDTNAGKAGFVTALYIVLVPLAGLFAGKRPGWRIWLAVLLSVAGLYLLCVTESFTITAGDVYLVLCAIGFTAHILVIDRFSPRVDCVRMSCIQFFIASALCGVCALLWEQPTWSGVTACAIPILYAGVLSGAVGYTLQMLAQKDTDPTIASLIMCLESVFAVLGGWLLLGNLLSARELSGCALMFAGILLAQVPVRRRAIKANA